MKLLLIIFLSLSLNACQPYMIPSNLTEEDAGEYAALYQACKIVKYQYSVTFGYQNSTAVQKGIEDYLLNVNSFAAFRLLCDLRKRNFVL